MKQASTSFVRFLIDYFRVQKCFYKQLFIERKKSYPFELFCRQLYEFEVQKIFFLN